MYTTNLRFAYTGPCSAVGNVSGYRCVSDCRSRGREFDPGPVPYFRGDWSWNNFYGHSPLFRWFGPHSAVGNVSGYRCVSDCRSRDREFDPGPVPYFRGDWSWNNFYGHSPLFGWFIQERLLSVISESMCTNKWLTACSSLPRKKCG